MEPLGLGLEPLGLESRQGWAWLPARVPQRVMRARAMVGLGLGLGLGHGLGLGLGLALPRLCVCLANPDRQPNPNPDQVPRDARLVHRGVPHDTNVLGAARVSHPNNPNPNPNPKPKPKPKPRLARTLARTPALARILTRYHVLYLLHIGTTLFYYYSHIRSGLGLGLTLTLTLTQLTLTLTLTLTRTLTRTSARRTRWASTTATGPPASPPKHCRSSVQRGR